MPCEKSEFVGISNENEFSALSVASGGNKCENCASSGRMEKMID